MPLENISVMLTVMNWGIIPCRGGRARRQELTCTYKSVVWILDQVQYDNVGAFMLKKIFVFICRDFSTSLFSGNLII